MGNSASQNTGGDGDNDAGVMDDPFDGIDTLGYRVLGVQPNSPAEAAGLVSFLDFLVGANQKMLLGSGEDLAPGEEYDDVDLPAFLLVNKGKEVEFLVWNIKSQTARLVLLTPSDTWGGAGLLGVTIRLDNYAGAEDRMIRVLTVEPKSPAAVAGLVPERDFILGTTHETLDSTEALANMLRSHQDMVVELYVYNTDSDLVRVVALMPTLSWGGRGLLGAEVGTGYLHRLPSAARQTSGASVARRVRYVGVPSGSNNTSSTNGLGGVSSMAGSPSREGELTGPSGTPLLTDLSGAQGGPVVLELEPQLEMEVVQEEEEEEPKHTTRPTAQPSLAKESRSEHQSRAESTSRSPMPPNGQNAASDASLHQQQQQQQPAPSLAMSGAASVFSKPPPAFTDPPPHGAVTETLPQGSAVTAATTSSDNSQPIIYSFLPPPPKLYYDSPASLR